MNHEYFRCDREANIDSVLANIRKQKPEKGQGLAAGLYSGLRRWTAAKIMKNDGEAAEVEQEIMQDGKRKVQWSEISATCVIGDSIIIGFGNGAVICIDTSQGLEMEKSITYRNMNFTGAENKAVDKLRVLTIESFGTKDIQVESIVLSLSGGRIGFHNFPGFSPCDYLDLDEIIDFEWYKKSVTIRDEKSLKKVDEYYLACLSIPDAYKQKKLKIYLFDRNLETFECITKINLMGSKDLPIFDGGISVYQGIFLI